MDPAPFRDKDLDPNERGEFRPVLRDGQSSLVVGIVFMTACLAAAGMLAGHTEGNPFLSALSESLVVAAWVGMWRPIEIGLYERWPLRRRMQILERLGRAPSMRNPDERAEEHPIFLDPDTIPWAIVYRAPDAKHGLDTLLAYRTAQRPRSA